LEIARGGPDAALDTIRHLRMPDHHDVRAEDVDLKRLGAVLATACDRDLKGFADLLLVENLGPRTLQTMALIAEVVHGAPTRFSDPARFSFALGGKDGHPFPVPLKTYDESLGVLRRSLDRAKLDGGEKTDGLRRLDRFVNQVENRIQPQADFDAVIAHERRISKSLGGRTVFDDKPARRKAIPPAQLSLF
ncbi:MAG TPA: DUF763 domain-containing protein, partial [Bryobacteraceae bacterium]|nr:DUF763 domain-containing protein [Bryobacteraceae bacterium]